MTELASGFVVHVLNAVLFLPMAAEHGNAGEGFAPNNRQTTRSPYRRLRSTCC
jgi:hypothetical protein